MISWQGLLVPWPKFCPYPMCTEEAWVCFHLNCPDEALGVWLSFTSVLVASWVLLQLHRPAKPKPHPPSCSKQSSPSPSNFHHGSALFSSCSYACSPRRYLNVVNSCCTSRTSSSSLYSRPFLRKVGLQYRLGHWKKRIGPVRFN